MKRSDIPKAKTRYLSTDNVFDAALERIEWLFREFDDIAVSFSGGKDSTVVLELALMVAKKLDRLPLKVIWLDQECEFEGTVEYARYINERPEIAFDWLQVPFRLFNATSHIDHWLNVWGEGEEWVRDKEPDSIHALPFPIQSTRFVEVLHEVSVKLAEQAGGRRCTLTGVRCEESPSRRAGLTSFATYKWATWGAKIKAPDVINMHPLFDWSWRDIWKAIHDNGWRYNTVYDEQFRHGVKPLAMRVSNYHHETAIQNLYWLQEVEPDTWNKATARVQGIGTVGTMQKDFFVTKLPFMFNTWMEYADYLLEHLPANEADQEAFRAQRERLLWNFRDRDDLDAFAGRAIAQSICANDTFGTKVQNIIAACATRKPKEPKA